MRINRKSKTTILIVLLCIFFLWLIIKARQTDNLDRIRTIFELCNKYPNDLGKLFSINLFLLPNIFTLNFTKKSQRD